MIVAINNYFEQRRMRAAQALREDAYHCRLYVDIRRAELILESLMSEDGDLTEENISEKIAKYQDEIKTLEELREELESSSWYQEELKRDKRHSIYIHILEACLVLFFLTFAVSAIMSCVSTL